jgi:O-antigen/teichoic acid export membrane protein
LNISYSYIKEQIKHNSIFLKNLLHTLLARGYSIILGFLSIIITSRYLGPDGRGLYAFIATSTAFAIQLGNLGFHASNIYYSGVYPRTFGKLFNNTLFMSVFVGLILGIITIYFTNDFIIKYSKFPFLIYSSILLFIPCSLFSLLIQNLLLGINDIFGYNFSEFLNKTIVIILFFILVWQNKSNADLFFLAYTISIIFSSMYLFYKANAKINSKIKFNKKFFRITIKYGLKSYFSSLLSYAVIRISIMIVAKMLSIEAVGIFSVSFAIFDVIYAITTVFATLIFPNLTSNPNNKFQAQLVIKNILAVSMFVLISCILFLLFGEATISIVLGEKFTLSAHMFYFLMPGLFFLSNNSILMNYFGAKGLPNVVIYSPAIALIIIIICLYFFIPKFGLPAAGISFSIASLSMFISSVIYLKKINFKSYLND